LKEETPSRISDRAASKVVYHELSDEDFDAAAFDKIAYTQIFKTSAKNHLFPKKK